MYVMAIQGPLFQLMEMGWWQLSTHQASPTQVSNFLLVCRHQANSVQLYFLSSRNLALSLALVKD